MSWGIFPLFFASFGLGVERIGILKAVYPATWGILQIATGPLSDRWGRKGLIVAGMWVQAAGLFLTAATRQFEWWLVGSLLLGLGTAMVYPSLIAAVSDASHPTWRARSLSVYRFWRDLGYAIGALSAGIIADLFGLSGRSASIATLTFLSGVVVAVLMRERAAGSLTSRKNQADRRSRVNFCAMMEQANAESLDPNGRRGRVALVLTPGAVWAQAPSDAERYVYGPHMMWWGGGWYGMIFGPLFMILLLAVRDRRRGPSRPLARRAMAGKPPHLPPARTPLDILKERFARGEIDKDEFEERRRVLGE